MKGDLGKIRLGEIKVVAHHIAPYDLWCNRRQKRRQTPLKIASDVPETTVEL